MGRGFFGNASITNRYNRVEHSYSLYVTDSPLLADWSGWSSESLVVNQKFGSTVVAVIVPSFIVPFRSVWLTSNCIEVVFFWARPLVVFLSWFLVQARRQRGWESGLPLLLIRARRRQKREPVLPLLLTTDTLGSVVHLKCNSKTTLWMCTAWYLSRS